jgi:hypothetical protein
VEFLPWALSRLGLRRQVGELELADLDAYREHLEDRMPLSRLPEAVAQSSYVGGISNAALSCSVVAGRP